MHNWDSASYELGISTLEPFAYSQCHTYSNSQLYHFIISQPHHFTLILLLHFSISRCHNFRVSRFRNFATEFTIPNDMSNLNSVYFLSFHACLCNTVSIRACFTYLGGEKVVNVLFFGFIFDTCFFYWYNFTLSTLISVILYHKSHAGRYHCEVFTTAKSTFGGVILYVTCKKCACIPKYDRSPNSMPIEDQLD